MSTNTNLIRVSNQLERVKSEVKARTDRCFDEDGSLNADLFSIKNPDISQSLGDYLEERTTECRELQIQIDNYLKAEGALKSLDDIVSIGKQKVGSTPNIIVPGNSLADQIFKSDLWQPFLDKNQKVFSHESEIGMKALFETTSAEAADHVSVESVRTGDYVSLPRTRFTLMDVIPQLTTQYPVVKYDQETKNLSAMGSISQGDVYQESEFTIAEKSVDVDKSGAFIQVSEEALMDRAELRSRLDNNLMAQLYRRVQADIIGGTLQNTAEYVAGASANTSVTGFLDIADADTNVLDTQDGLNSGEKKNEIEALFEADELVYRNGEADSTAILMNSQDWRKVMTLQSTTGSFIVRGAMNSLAGAIPMMVDRWPVVLCNALPVGTVVIGDFANHCVIRDRQQAQVRIQEAQAVSVPAIPGAGAAAQTLQTKPAGRYNIFADVRYAFIVRRTLAFCRITNFGIAKA